MAADENNIERDKENVILLNKNKPHAYIKTTNHANMEVVNGVCAKRTTTQYCEELQTWMWQYYTGYVHWQSWGSVCANYYLLHPANGTTTAHTEFTGFDAQNWYNNPFGLPLSTYYSPGTPGTPSPSSHTGQAPGTSSLAAAAAVPPHTQQQQTQDHRNAHRPGIHGSILNMYIQDPSHMFNCNLHLQRFTGREYIIPSPFQRLVAEIVDFFILFFIKSTIIISIMHLTGMK